jgi:hypothetical protein
MNNYSQWGSRVQENLFKGQARNYTTSNASAPFKVTGNTGAVHENFMDAGFGGARKAAAGVSRRSLHSTSMALNALPKGAEGSWGSVHPRKLLIGGNWKSNGDVKFVNSFPGEVLNKAKYDTNLLQVVVAPTEIHLSDALKNISNNVQVAA